MLSIIGIQIFSIIRFVKKGESVKFDDSYSDEAIEKTKIIVDAIRTNKIKKHILTNSAHITHQEHPTKDALKYFQYRPTALIA